MKTYTKKPPKRSKQDEEILLNFATNLRKARIKTGYSQEEVAHQAGFSRSYYAEMETGRRNISLLNLKKLMIALEIEASNLIDSKKDK